MNTNLAVTLLGCLAVYAALHLLQKQMQDQGEPPTIPCSVPFIEPLFRLLNEKNQYFVWLRDRYSHPICTIRLPGTRIYIVNQISLIVSAQRQVRSLSLRPIEARIAALAISGCSKNAYKILMHNINGVEGDRGYTTSVHKAMLAHLSPGYSLYTMNSIVLAALSKQLHDNINVEPLRIDLFAWVAHLVTLATTDAVYGESNPFRAPEVEAAFWTFEPSIGSLLLGVLHSLTARKCFMAREALVKSFRDYFEGFGHKHGSFFVQRRYELGIEYMMSLDDIARLEIAMVVAILSNTVPTAFWMIYHIYSDQDTLTDCRKEVSRLATTEGQSPIVHISNIKATCPIMQSTLQEVLRHHNVGVSARMVMSDFDLDHKYHLKKGNIVLMPARVLHNDTSLWDPDAGSFDFERFTKANIRPGAFRGFGGGSTLCPGRHFASLETLALAAMLVLCLEIQPECAYWAKPTTHKAAMWAAMPKPDHDIPVIITCRDQITKQYRWTYS